MGKGLEALISTSVDKREYIIELEPSKIIQNPTQPRKKLEPDHIKELANSIMAKGIIQPLIARAQEGKYEIVLFGKTSYKEAEKKSVREFVTNDDGVYPAKSPVGMFNELYIPNDLGYVVAKANAYYQGE